MTQFASTLYPQTNPTNVILHEFRFHKETAALNPGMTPDTPMEWLAYSERYQRLWNTFERSQLDHARRVLTRLADFSG